MTIQMKQDQFDALPIDAIGHACFEPMVPVYQGGMRGKNGAEAAAYRAEFFATLSQGQRALFMFFTWYDHAIRSEDEFLRISQQYLSANIFGAVKKAVNHFGDGDMLRLLEKVALVLAENNDCEIPVLYRELKELSSHTLATIGLRIKEAPAEFVVLI